MSTLNWNSQPNMSEVIKLFNEISGGSGGKISEEQDYDKDETNSDYINWSKTTGVKVEEQMSAPWRLTREVIQDVHQLTLILPAARAKQCHEMLMIKKGYISECFIGLASLPREK